MTQKLDPEPFDQEKRVTEVRQGQEERPLTPAPPSGESGSVHREEVVRDVGSERRQQLNRVSQLIWLLLGIADGLIALRVILKLIAANPENDFADFIYSITKPLVAPFFGITGTPTANGSVLEIGSIIAMVVYFFAAWIVVRLISLIFARPSARSVTVEDRNRK